MAAPSQEFPSWLTPSVSIITNAAGVPVTTSTTVLFLPLTYYGPSIPLNSDWTYGGLTSPASTSTIPVTETTPGTIPITITTAIPSTITPNPTSISSAATPITSVSLSSSSSSSSPILSLPSSSLPTSTPSSTPIVTGSSSRLSRGQLIGVIVASILGVIFLFALALCATLWYRGRRNRLRDSRFSMVAPIDEDYMVVSTEGRSLGEGSPRHSGEEADPFLQRSRNSAAPAAPIDPEMGARGSAPPYAGITRVPAPPSGSLSSSGTSSTNHSGYGTLIERPTLNLLPSTTEELERGRRGQILTPEELRQMDEETVLPKAAEYSPLMPPPRLVDPQFSWAPPLDRPAFKPQPSYMSQMSSYPDIEEPATLLTARRVRAEDLAPRSPPQQPLPLTDESSSGGFLSGLGLGLTNLGRMSWFRNSDTSSRRNSRARSFVATALTDDDIEVGRSLLGPQMSESQTSRGISVGAGPDGDRPISALSALSMGTVYHDAQTSLPGTPVSATPLAPLPRALTPSGNNVPERGWPSTSTVTTGEPPAYDHPDSTSQTTSVTHLNHGLSTEFDILDMPVPSAVSPFASTSSASSSLRDTATSGSLGTRTIPYPPGLELGTSKPWIDMTSPVTTQLFGPYSVVSSRENQPGISIDVLEEEPPSAGEGWRSMAAIINEGHERRTTFGGFVPAHDIVSEQGSLYSMRSHISPSRSTGSAPASRRDMSGSTGSASSRPSAFSAARTGSSGHSLAHSGSITSEDRKRRHGTSPTLSAFGHHGSRSEPPLSPVINSPPTAHFAERTGTIRTASPGAAAVSIIPGSSNEPTSPASPVMQLSSAPWATGLDHNWTAT